MDGDRTLLLASSPDPVDRAEGSLFFVGTATVVLRYAGFTILTDPNFLHQGQVAHLGYGLRSKRRTNPATELEDLPPVDVVVLSHLHEDHFDRVVIERLDRSLPILTTPQAATALRRHGFTATWALRTWEALTVVKGTSTMRVTSLPGRHGPPLVGRLLPPVMGSMVDFSAEGEDPALRVYVTGDTLLYAAIRQIPHRFPGIDLALLHLGGTRALGILVTMDARQGVDMVRTVNPATTVPIHYDDYTVFTSPLEDFQREVEAAGLRKRVHYVRHGDTYRFPVVAGGGR